MNKKTAKLLTFALIVGGATAIYLYFSKKNTNKGEIPLPPSPLSPINDDKYFNAKVNTNTTDLNVRKEPNTTSLIVKKLKKGTNILVSDDINGWRKIVDNSKNTVGYVSSQYVILT